MSGAEGTATLPASVAETLGDPAAVALWRELVALAPTNLEDPPRGRYEKPRYAAAARRLQAVATEWGLSARTFDPVEAGGREAEELRGIPRPNVIVDLPGASPERVLVLAHYDVVPVPDEQRPRWRSPPHTLTYRSDGRLYGRGSSDDLGSGVVASLLALKRLSHGPAPARSVRLLLCCDEETGGEGGIEAMKRHDAGLPEGSPDRLIAGDVALLPDGSPHVCAASSGAVFMDLVVHAPAPLSGILDLADAVAELSGRVAEWRSRFPSPDWPDHGAPAPWIQGRLTLTRFDLEAVPPAGPAAALENAHAETDTANQIAESVALGFAPPATAAPAVLERLGVLARSPYRVAPTGATGLAVPAGGFAVSVIGESAHGGYPHRAHNPVPATTGILRAALGRGWIGADRRYRATFAIDLRLPPEMPLEEGRGPVLAWVRSIIDRLGVPATIESPPARCRGGYALDADHPAARRLERIVAETLGVHGVFGEYGGTDASTLGTVRTRSGAPLPALVFGSMDRASNIHQAEENADPRLVAGVAAAIERYVRDP
ncbi:MAG TPA: M20/M25/M40 family metallo-hydrolase [Thermoplasmata archaeon]|nr:M20/M25/M40 family metallo-hydrolase [Thermoplasmata archaeon]